MFAGADERRSQPATLVRLQLAPCVWAKSGRFHPQRICARALEALHQGSGGEGEKKSGSGKRLVSAVATQASRAERVGR